MSGSVSGGLSAAATIKKRDPDHFQRIGAMGGKKGRTGGFYADRKLAHTAGRKGGAKSKRGYRFVKEKGGYTYYAAIDTGKIKKHEVVTDPGVNTQKG